jgi:hypothetical protein
MCKLRKLLKSIAIFVLISAPPAEAVEVYMTPDDYMMESERERLGFVQGVFDTFSAMTHAELISDETVVLRINRIQDCPRSKMTITELERAFTGWLEAHPQRWDDTVPLLLIEAIDGYCAGSIDSTMPSSQADQLLSGRVTARRGKSPKK